MTHLPVLSWEDMVKILVRKGWSPARQNGSHIVMQIRGNPFHQVIPKHRELSPGVIKECIRVAGLTEEDFN